MSTNAQRTTVVNLSCMDYLHIEMVKYAQEHTDGTPDALFHLLERIGFVVGQKLVERHCKDRPLFKDNLDRVKFICKEFWMILFHKMIDNLRTNYRGVFVLENTEFRWLSLISGERTQEPRTTELAARYLYFACGIIRGALSNLGVQCVVHAEISTLPSCKFTVKVKEGVGSSSTGSSTPSSTPSDTSSGTAIHKKN